MLKVLICLVMGYLIGSLNFAIIYSKLRRDDIRNHGSGNAGSTNVLRTYGKTPALCVFILDISKGIIAVIISRVIFGTDMFPGCSAALGAILGHNFPVYYGFKGGKGVATSIAVLFVLHFPTALIAVAAFVVTVLISRIVSLSSIVGSLAAMLASVIFFKIDVFSVFCIIIGLLCIIRHSANIKRLINGTESRLGQKKS